MNYLAEGVKRVVPVYACEGRTVVSSGGRAGRSGFYRSYSNRLRRKTVERFTIPMIARGTTDAK
ncbi:hypothetical protein J2W42_006545 [Rhizobium tibeticum]|nr:hypothetical protein [Rhizobium tibeticum]